MDAKRVKKNYNTLSKLQKKTSSLNFDSDPALISTSKIHKW